MSVVFRNIDPPPTHRPVNVPLVRGEDTLARGRGGGGSIVQKTPNMLCILYMLVLCAYTHLQLHILYRGPWLLAKRRATEWPGPKSNSSLMRSKGKREFLLSS